MSSKEIKQLFRALNLYGMPYLCKYLVMGGWMDGPDGPFRMYCCINTKC